MFSKLPLDECTSQARLPAETFNRSKRAVQRTIETSDGRKLRSRQPGSTVRVTGDPGADFEWAWLRSAHQRLNRPRKQIGSIRVVDLFSGCGGMTLGVSEACRALELGFGVSLAADLDDVALKIFQKNFPTDRAESEPIEMFIDSELSSKPSLSERQVATELGPVDLLVGGPPCQGHSDLNNRTRRIDPKNALMARMARFAEVIGPEHIIIENVQGVRHDQDGVVETTREALEKTGYFVDEGLVDLSQIGVPQRRRRFVMVASRSRAVKISKVLKAFSVSPRNLEWAIGDLEPIDGGALLDTPSTPTPISRRRIDYLFDHDLHNLPDHQRPPCHRNKTHTYRSVYGRLDWEEPAQTITTGFGCMGQGRYVHPSCRRTLTPHEAARIQFFPDFFDFDGASRTKLAALIGNAVPPKLTYLLALSLLG